MPENALNIPIFHQMKFSFTEHCRRNMLGHLLGRKKYLKALKRQVISIFNFALVCQQIILLGNKNK